MMSFWLSDKFWIIAVISYNVKLPLWAATEKKWAHFPSQIPSAPAATWTGSTLGASPAPGQRIETGSKTQDIAWRSDLGGVYLGRDKVRDALVGLRLGMISEKFLHYLYYFFRCFFRGIMTAAVDDYQLGIFYVVMEAHPIFHGN